jgi:hypothetical protein
MKGPGNGLEARSTHMLEMRKQQQHFSGKTQEQILKNKTTWKDLD